MFKNNSKNTCFLIKNITIFVLKYLHKHKIIYTMKARTLIPVFFLIFFLGMQMEANAQASASVSFTIVVPENFHEPLDDDNRSFDSAYYLADANSEATASVSVQMISSANDQEELQAFETEMNAANSPAIVDMLGQQLNQNKPAPVAKLQTERYVKDDGQYLVVMEYN